MVAAGSVPALERASMQGSGLHRQCSVLSPGSSITWFANLAHSHNICRKDLCGPSAVCQGKTRVCPFFLFHFVFKKKKKNCKKIFSEMQGRLYFVLPWPSPCSRHPQAPWRVWFQWQQDTLFINWDEHCPHSARGEQSVCACHKSVTLFSTAAAICCSLYPSCIFCAVGSSSKAVMICNQTELTGSLSPAHNTQPAEHHALWRTPS